MNHSNLSPELNRFVELAERNNGFLLAELAEDAMFEIHTRKSRYTVVVIDPEIGAIAVTGGKLGSEESDIFFFQGSGLSPGSSMLKVGWVGMGLCFQAKRADGALLSTSTIGTFVMLNDPAKAKIIREKAQAKWPHALEIATEEEIRQLNEKLDKKIEIEFAGEHLKSVQGWLEKFRLDGKYCVADFFSAAKGVGKLKEALDIMGQQYIDHWRYKPPWIRGEVDTPADARQWQRAYQQIGLDF